MDSLRKILFLFIIFNFSIVNAKPIPESFADLAEKLITIKNNNILLTNFI